MKEKPAWASNIKFLCFDVDGTLYRNVPEIWNVVQKQIHHFVAKQKKWSLEKTQEEFDQRYQKLASSTKVLESFELDAKTFFDKVFAKINFRRFISPDEKLFNLIENLRKKYLVGILSNGSVFSISKKLAAIGLNHQQFSPFLATYEFGSLKPDPAPFLKVVEDAGVKPEESVYIGDREETDVLGAQAVGMRAVLVWGESKEADLSISTIYDLKSYFLAPKQL